MSPRSLVFLTLLSCQRDAAPGNEPRPEGNVPSAVAVAPPARKAREEGAVGGGRSDGANKDQPLAGGFGETDQDLRRSPADGESSPPESPARAWFPESFLWQPLLETSEAGVLTVPVHVPDTLTTWRLLAVGQSAEGAQGGTTAAFLSTLPAYVEVVVPRFLYVGDRVALPVQVVNQGEAPLGGPLRVEAGELRLAVDTRVPAGGSLVRTVELAPRGAGVVSVRADFGDVDHVEKEVEVWPSGRRLEIVRGGTLAGPRTLSIDGLPGGSDGELCVTVYPGARAVFTEELAVAGERDGGPADAAYAWALLAGEAGPSLDPETRRARQLRAFQQLTRATWMAAPEPGVAALVAAGLRSAHGDDLPGRSADHLARVLAAGQGPDGIYPLAPGTPLDEVLVHTSRVVWAIGERTPSVRLRARGAIERHHDRLANPAVAAWALAADLLDEADSMAAREVLLRALETAPDGTRRLSAAPGVAAAELTALASLVLEDPVLRADLAASLLTRHRRSTGFGPGWSNLVAIAALDGALGGKIPDAVRVDLQVDGQSAGSATLDPKDRYAPITLRGPALDDAGPHRVVVSASPPVPGLAFTLVASTSVPWTQLAPRGFDIEVKPGALHVGEEGSVAVVVSGARGAVVDVDVGLPAGFAVASDRLPADAGSWRVEDGALHLTGLVLEEATRVLVVPGVPQFAGVLWSGPATVTDGREGFTRVPARWTVR